MKKISLQKLLNARTRPVLIFFKPAFCLSLKSKSTETNVVLLWLPVVCIYAFLVFLRLTWKFNNFRTSCCVAWSHIWKYPIFFLLPYIGKVNRFQLDSFLSVQSKTFNYINHKNISQAIIMKLTRKIIYFFLNH